MCIWFFLFIYHIHINLYIPYIYIYIYTTFYVLTLTRQGLEKQKEEVLLRGMVEPGIFLVPDGFNMILVIRKWLVFGGKRTVVRIRNRTMPAIAGKTKFLHVFTTVRMGMCLIQEQTCRYFSAKNGGLTKQPG